MKSDSETPTSNAITDMWNLKKGNNELLCRRDTDSQTLKNLRFPRETGWGVGVELRVWDANAVKLGCDDHCITINVIKFIDQKKKKRGNWTHMNCLKAQNHSQNRESGANSKKSHLFVFKVLRI